MRADARRAANHRGELGQIADGRISWAREVSRSTNRVIAQRRNRLIAKLRGGESKTMFTIEINNQQTALSIDADRLRRAAQTILEEEGLADAVVNIAVVDDAA